MDIKRFKTSHNFGNSQASPEKVFEQQRKLMEEKLVYGELPLLQAVVVCVKRFMYDEVDVTRIPQPTILREGPGSFGLEITEFYLNPTLGHCLDLKLQRFLNIPNNLQFLYERVMRKIDLMEEQEIKAELRKVDSQHSNRLDSTNKTFKDFKFLLPQMDTWADA